MVRSGGISLPVKDLTNFQLKCKSIKTCTKYYYKIHLKMFTEHLQ